jgi:hypothetical protein
VTDKQFEDLINAINRGFERVLEVMSAARDDSHGETLEYPHTAFANFEWASIGASVIDSDADGVSVIRAANGRIARRRSKDKFDAAIWFSYAKGKKPDGATEYHQVIKFVTVDPADPIGRKASQALSKAQSTPPADARKPEPEKGRAGQLAGIPESSLQCGSVDDPMSRWNGAVRAASAAGVALPEDLANLTGADNAASIDRKARAIVNRTRAHKHPGNKVMRDLLTELYLATEEAIAAGIELPPAAVYADDDTAEMLGARVSTLNNVLEARKRSGPPPSGAPALQKQLLDDVQANQKRAVSDDARTQAAYALLRLCGNEALAGRFVGAVFGRAKFGDLTMAEQAALWHWLKPSGKGRDAQATNAHASAQLSEFMQALQPA